jgi:cell division protein FtsN
MQDYKYLHYKNKRPKKSGFKKLFVLLFVIVVIAVPASIYFKQSGYSIDPTKPVATPATPALKINQIDPEVAKRFTFYDILATGESIIQDGEQIATATATADNKIYLQLNAFKTAKEADDFQVQIKLIELNPSIESLFLHDKGGQWFAVRLGPFEKDDDITRTKATLRAHDYPFAVVLRKN